MNKILMKGLVVTYVTAGAYLSFNYLMNGAVGQAVVMLTSMVLTRKLVKGIIRL